MKPDEMPMCGDAEMYDGKGWHVPNERDCPHYATRLSYVYERLSIFVCDAPFEGDHEYAEPWAEDTIEDVERDSIVRDAAAITKIGEAQTAIEKLIRDEHKETREQLLRELARSH